MGKNRFADIYGDYTITALDNSGYSLVFCGGTIAIVNTFGSVLAEFDAYDIPAVDVTPVIHCDECYLHGHCVVEGVFNTVRMPDNKMFCAVGKRKHDNADYCVCCGEIIPEGRQICQKCENSADF